MSYSRPCGVSVADCGATECRCVSVDPGDEIGLQNAAYAIRCNFCHAEPGSYCRRHRFGEPLAEPHPSRVIAAESLDFPCCATPVQRAHNHSRED